MSWGDVQARWAATLVANLAAAGVQHVVLSPGSRSTPLVLALEVSSLRVTHVLDERSAAFVALGQARVNGVASALVCTSGSALAHYAPAFVEAREAHVPLLAVTADRPPGLQHVGASQTTAQAGVLASHAVWTLDMGLPEAGDAALASLATRVSRAVFEAHDRRGPVHINVPFQKPFEPTAWPLSTANLPIGPFAPRPPRGPAPTAIERAADAIVTARSGVIAVGPTALGTDLRAAQALCAATGFTLLAESTSQLRDGVVRTSTGAAFTRADAFDALLRNPDFRGQAQADVVLHLGAFPVSKWFGAWLTERANAEHVTTIAIAANGWPDPTHAADVMIAAPLDDACRALLDALARRDDDYAGQTAELRTEVDASAARWVRADAAAWESTFGAVLAGGDALTEATVVRTVSALLPDGGVLSVGNSLPVRAFDWFVQALPEHVGVLSQRGVAGIDGVLSGAIGAAIASPGRPVTAVMGDSTFLHDVGALQASATLGEDPLTVVVINNDGGRIFERLPVAALANADAVVSRSFVMPHGQSPAAIATAFGVTAHVVTTCAELSEAMREAQERPGLTVIEAVVDGDASTAETRRIFEQVDAAVTASLRTDVAIPAFAVVEDER